jgi:hypothetical protein
MKRLFSAVVLLGAVGLVGCGGAQVLAARRGFVFLSDGLAVSSDRGEPKYCWGAPGDALFVDDVHVTTASRACASECATVVVRDLASGTVLSTQEGPVPGSLHSGVMTSSGGLNFVGFFRDVHPDGPYSRSYEFRGWELGLGSEDNLTFSVRRPAGWPPAVQVGDWIVQPVDYWYNYGSGRSLRAVSR